MKEADNNDSFIMLKEKFDEIRRNIDRLQNKQSDLIQHPLSYHYNGRSPIRVEQSPMESSISSYIRMLKSLEVEKDLMQQSVEQLKAERDTLIDENQKLLRGSKNQQLLIDKITRENEELKKKLLEHKRPSSCLKGEFSTPKKHRVNFSRDLTDVIHIKKDDCPSFVNVAKRRNDDLSKQINNMGFARYTPARRNEWFKDFYN